MVNALYIDYLLELFPKVKELGLTILLDSNGSYDFSNDNRLLDLIDCVMLDVKAANEKRSNELIKYSNEIVLKNLEYLLEHNKLYEVRTVIFPDKDDENKETIKYVSNIIKDKCNYKLIRYRPYGVREEYKKVVGLTTSEDYADTCVEYTIKCGATKAYYL